MYGQKNRFWFELTRDLWVSEGSRNRESTVNSINFFICLFVCRIKSALASSRALLKLMQLCALNRWWLPYRHFSHLPLPEPRQGELHVRGEPVLPCRCLCLCLCRCQCRCLCQCPNQFHIPYSHPPVVERTLAAMKNQKARARNIMTTTKIRKIRLLAVAFFCREFSYFSF